MFAADGMHLPIIPSLFLKVPDATAPRATTKASRTTAFRKPTRTSGRQPSTRSGPSHRQNWMTACKRLFTLAAARRTYGATGVEIAARPS